jgi:glycosyltransferase involved in cell wall biosynthesis
MISIITPFYNAQDYLKDAIHSVLNQSLDDWELILINDGSTDSSKNIALSFNDNRIKYYEQSNKGVAAARNKGLSMVRGDFITFLDSDDVLPPNSLKARRKLFDENPQLAFADGIVIKKSADMNTVFEEWKPSFRGNPLHDLCRLGGRSFLGLTWMIKRNPNKNYKFNEFLTHSEDLLFFMKLARDGSEYTYTEEPTLIYRHSEKSAMSNLEGLEKGYRTVGSIIRNWKEIEQDDFKRYQYKWRRAMFLAYIRKMKIIKAVNSLF